MWTLNTLSCGVLLTLPLLVSCESDEPPPKWEYYNPLSGETLLCDWCAPGEFMITECTQTTVTQCRTCAENEYTEHYNHVRECFRCRECLKPHEHVLLGCTPTNNRQCVCEDGFFLAAEFCFPHTKCPIRYGVVQRGTPWKNTKCRRCRSGTFSDVDSSVATCYLQEPHGLWDHGTVCHTEGEQGGGQRLWNMSGLQHNSSAEFRRRNNCIYGRVNRVYLRYVRMVSVSVMFESFWINQIKVDTMLWTS
ncbi:TNFRSF11B [Branchiostoma lanceolatum]|uniref:TNFRSF11B protein n=1 Tax=Branchiostoma lanceolatum TaxID=7740 RepID=A0A8J9W8E8_BRALA|nr:TNFRSF11B [Branchiostoma lanceolatum]